jgi:hypothetical protein
MGWWPFSLLTWLHSVGGVASGELPSNIAAEFELHASRRRNSPTESRQPRHLLPSGCAVVELA